MKTIVGVMGSGLDPLSGSANNIVSAKAEALGRTIAGKDVILFTGATTGIIYRVGKTAHDTGALHVGVSPAGNLREHMQRYQLPSDACDILIYTGFGLKGRNVVLVRSCDILLFIAGAMGSLNEFTIAHDEGKVIGCLTETGGVADEVEYLLEKFSKPTGAQVFLHTEPEQLLAACLESMNQ